MPARIFGNLVLNRRGLLCSRRKLAREPCAKGFHVSRTASIVVARPLSCRQEADEVMKSHTAGFQIIQKGSLKWV